MEKLKRMCVETYLTNKKIETQRRLNILGVIFITNKEKADLSSLWDSKLTHVLICTITTRVFTHLVSL